MSLLLGLSLAYRPFFHPLPVAGYWLWLLLPLVAAIAVVIKALRLADLRQLPRQVAMLTFQITAFMVLAAAAIWLIVELL